MRGPLSIVFFILLPIAVSIVVASKLTKRLKVEQPEARPYRWGYFFGAMAVATFLPAGAMLITWISPPHERLCVVSFPFCFMLAVCGWFILQRRKWAWITGTLLIPNLIVWIFNAVYGARRWPEFQMAKRQRQSESTRKALFTLALAYWTAGMLIAAVDTLYSSAH